MQENPQPSSQPSPQSSQEQQPSSQTPKQSCQSPQQAEQEDLSLWQQLCKFFEDEKKDAPNASNTAAESPQASGEKEEEPTSWTALLLSMALGSALFLGYHHSRQHPNFLFHKEIAAGYVDPRKCEFSREDIEGKGEYHAVLRYQNTPYLLVKKNDGTLEAQPYLVRVEEQTNNDARATSSVAPPARKGNVWVTLDSLSGTREGSVEKKDERDHETAHQTWERLQQESYEVKKDKERNGSPLTKEEIMRKYNIK